MQSYDSPFYNFLMYLNVGTIILTFALMVVAIILGIFGIRALMIYIQNNRVPKTGAEPVKMKESAFSKDAVGGEPGGDDKLEEVEAEIVFDPEKDNNEGN